MTFLDQVKYTALCAGFLLIAAGDALAQGEIGNNADDGLMPQTAVSVDVDASFSATEETHPPLRLTPDKSEILELDADVERVIIGNDVHANVVMDTSSRLVVVPRLPGATHVTLLGADGKILMQRYIIVASPGQKYLRLRNPCSSGASNGAALQGCMPVRMYYCPDMCHEVAIVGEDGEAFSGSAAYQADEATETAADGLQLPATLPQTTTPPPAQEEAQ